MEVIFIFIAFVLLDVAVDLVWQSLKREIKKGGQSVQDQPPAR